MTQTQPAVGAPGTHAHTVPAVALHGLTKRFGAVTAVDGLDLAIQPGEIVAFLGPNGAGKTSTIDMVLGLSRPDGGTAEVFGMAPRTAVAHGLVTAVMQTGGLLKDLTVAETVELTAALFAHTRPVAEVLRAGRARPTSPDRRVGRCSGGEQQRLRFAMALLPEPELIILDEPTTGMDVEGRREFWSAIRADAERGRTVVFATHYLDEADAYADRIVLVSRGRVVADGTAAQIKALVRRPDGHAPPGRTSDRRRRRAAAAARRRGRRAARRHRPVRAADSDAVARHLLTTHARPRPADHLARPRGRLPRPDRRRPADRPDDRHRPFPTAASRRWAASR